MFALVPPHPGLHRSFLEAADEFVAEGQDSYANLLVWPADPGFAGIDFSRDRLESQQVFAEFTDFLRGQALRDASRPAERVPMTELWMADGARYLGRISLRHRLNDLLLTWGGHVGYAVRPTARGKGYASRALLDLLPTCADLGIDPVLVTCDLDNVASRRVIEKAGGVYEDARNGKLRFWVPSAVH